MPKGWSIVGVSAAVVVAMCVVLLALHGTGEDGLRVVIRATARTSVALFTLAFVASSVRRLWPGAVSRWLVANRRYLGVSFACSHLCHLLAIMALVDWSVAAFFTRAGLLTGILGGLGYLLVAAMAATSFDRTAAWLGHPWWDRLHTFGAYYVWTVFLLTFAPRIAESPVLYGFFTLLLVAALALRLGTRRALPAPARAGVSRATG